MSLKETLTQFPRIDAPDWLLTRKKEAFSLFQDQPFPNQEQETWRYVDLSKFLSSNLVLHESTLPKVSPQKGLTAQSLSSMGTDVPLTLGVSGYVFSFLNTVHFHDGLYLRANEKVEEPVVLDSFPDRLYVSVKKGASLSLVIHEKEGDATGFKNSFLEMDVEEGASVSVVVVNADAKGPHFMTMKTDLAENASLKFIRFTRRDHDLSRYDTFVNFNGAGAHAVLKGVSMLSSDAKLYNHLVVNHFVGDTTCEQVFKHILTGESESEFCGLVKVHKKAHGTGSKQLNQNLLLSDKARALSRPQLQIDADDVECAHGCTVGQLNEDELFYLRSRGLSEAESKTLLTYGFACDVLQDVDHEPTRAFMESVVKQEVASYG